MKSPEITVIIPTLADVYRASNLVRAVNSVLSQTDVLTKIIVVVNGDVYEKSLVDHLKTLANVEVIIEVIPSVINARYQGLLRVQSPFFSFLDDDDEYLPESIKKRVTQLQVNPECILVASSGYRNENGKITSSAFNLTRAAKNPFEEMSVNNWFTSCGCVFRTNAVSAGVFRQLPPYHEWTYLAYKLLTLGPFCIVDEPCYMIYDSSISLSKTFEYSTAHAFVFRKILELDLPPKAIQSVKRRLAKAEHDLASIALKNGMWKLAVIHHLKSLILPGGLRYFIFTRHLFNFKKCT